MERPWPLTGRDDQLRQVVTALRPGAAGVVVAGPAGVGKTRLVRTAAGSAATRGRSVVWAHGSKAAQPLPLGAFAGMIEVPAGDPVMTVGRALDQLRRRRPMVLVIDDGHLLDQHSTIVVHRVVVRELAPVVLTVRTGWPTADLVTMLWKDGLLPRIELDPLDLPATASLVSRVLAGPVDSAFVRRLWALTRGSPLFLRHLLRGELSAGRVSADSGIWRWDDAPTISAELAGLVGDEIGRLSGGVRDVVDLVALAEPIALTTVLTLTSHSDLEEAEDRGLVRTDGMVARLAHPLYGEVRRTGMGSVRARRLRGAVAQLLDPAPDPLPRAVLTLDSDLPPDPALFLRAAETATRVFDLPLAERLAGAAAATGQPDARLTHAAALSWLSRGDEAEAILADLAANAQDPPTLAMTQVHRAGNLFWTMARPVEAREAVADAEATGAVPFLAAAMSLCLTAATGDMDIVLARGPDLLRAAPADDLTRLLVACAVSAAAAVVGDTELLDEAAATGGFTAARVPSGIPAFGLADLQVLGHRLNGTPSRAAELAGRMRAASADLPGPARLMGLVVAGHAALAAGLLREATTMLREAWPGLERSGHEMRFRCRTLLATALAQSGRAQQADDLLAGIRAGGHPAYTMLDPDDLLARAWGAAAEGSTTMAVAHSTAAAGLARQRSAPAFEVLAWQTAVQLGDGHGALDRLETLPEIGPRRHVALAHARAWVRRDAESLRRLSDAWSDLGDLVAAGDAAAQAAEAYRQQGQRGSAFACAALAEEVATRTGARTPALAAAIHPLPLTAREREIVTLAARGLTNKEVAERLTVSVRTVEGHLYRAGHKLGVSQRSGLADVVGLPGGGSE